MSDREELRRQFREWDRTTTAQTDITGAVCRTCGKPATYIIDRRHSAIPEQVLERLFYCEDDAEAGYITVQEQTRLMRGRPS